MKVWSKDVDLIEVAAMIICGMTANQIAKKLQISRPTVVKIAKENLGEGLAVRLKENGLNRRAEVCRTARLGK